MLSEGRDNFPIMSYLKIFFRRKEVIIILGFLGLVVGICAGLLLPREYMSSTVIMVEEGKTDNPLFDKLAVSTTVQQRLETIRESILGWNSLVTLVKRLNLDKNAATAKEFENLVNNIRRRISIHMKGSNIIYLSYTGFDPAMTQSVVQNITDIFIGRNKEIQEKETADAIAFIEEQLKVYKGKIKSAEIAKMQDQLNDLLVDSTEKHPMVRELKEKIASKKEELRKENLEFTEAERLKVESDQPLVDSIKTALTKLETNGEVKKQEPAASNDFYKMMLLDKLQNVLARDAAVNEGIYNMLLQRLETAKITQRLQSSKEGTKYTIIDPPRIPLEPTKPNRVMLALTGLILGIVAGFAMVFAMEFLDKSFIDVEDAKEFLGVPLLGAISKICTEDSVRKEKEEKRWAYFLTFLAGIAALVITFSVTGMLK